MKTSVTKELFLGIFILIPTLYLVMVWQNLPEIVPTHWGIDGKADSFGSKNSLIALSLGLPIFIYLLLRFAPMIDPKQENYTIFKDTYYRLRIILTIFISFITIAIIYASQHPTQHFASKWILIAICFLFSAIGNYMPTLKPNWFIGIRTPWTLSNEEVWRKTHQLGGKIWFWGGFTGAIFTGIFPEMYAIYVFIALIIVLSIFPVVYSYLLMQKLKN